MRQKWRKNVTAKCGTRKRPLAAGQRRPNILAGNAGPTGGGNAFSDASWRPEEATMNYLRTAILLAGVAALFMGIGFLIGGGGGAGVALFLSAGMNLVTYWKPGPARPVVVHTPACADIPG